MPLRALLAGQSVMAWDVAGTGSFACAECGDPMHYVAMHKRKDGTRVNAHFAHNPASSGIPRSCSSIGQSEEHMNAKQTICMAAPNHFWWLRGLTGSVEVPLEHRRADVLFTRTDGRRIIFEPQFTKIPRSQIAERTRDYHAMGCDVVWCFPKKRFDDLYLWAKQHFYCVGLLDNDGNDIAFWGNLSPDRYAPGLKRPFDPDVIMPVISIPDEPWRAAPNDDEIGIPIYRKPNPMPSIAIPPRGTGHDAYHAWMSAGSIGLGLWLANYKEVTTGHRNYTIEEYGRWVAECRTLEYDHTGTNDEFCQRT